MLFTHEIHFLLNTDYNLSKILALGASNRPRRNLTAYKANVWSAGLVNQKQNNILYAMITWIILITPIIVVLSISCVIFQRQHLLIALLALEAIILSLVLMLFVVIRISWSILIIVILTFGACEASLGLACITTISRSYGNDRLNSLSLNKC